MLPTTFRAEVRALLGLALPVVVVQLGMMTMGVVDTAMVGRLSAGALGAVAIANVYFFGVSIFGTGALLALDPVVAQAVGARDEVAVARAMQRGILISTALTVLTSALLAPAEQVLGLLRQPADVVPAAGSYARALIPGIFPYFAFGVLRQGLQAIGRMRPVVLIIVAANLANLGLNRVLIYGKGGFPALGVVGSGWATTISRWLMTLGLLAVAWRSLHPMLLPPRRDALAWAPLVRMLRLGAPIGGQMQLEFGAFGVIALLMGWLGTDAMAGHQVAINLASVTFMVPLGVGTAAAVLVGQAVGRGDPAQVRRAAAAALACGAAFMCVSAAAMLTVPEVFARFYTTEARVAAVAAVLIPIAGVFQVFDGLQVVAIGVLRGVGDTRAPMLINILGFWLVGMPVSLYLGFRTGAGPRGLWWGLVAGLAAVASFLLLRVRARLTRPIGRVVIDADR